MVERWGLLELEWSRKASLTGSQNSERREAFLTLCLLLEAYIFFLSLIFPCSLGFLFTLAFLKIEVYNEEITLEDLVTQTVSHTKMISLVSLCGSHCAYYHPTTEFHSWLFTSHEPM